MPELVVASWNMQNAFGDTDRQNLALDVIERANADVVYTTEVAHDDEKSAELTDEAAVKMHSLGYTALMQTGYYEGAVPLNHNQHTMAMWSRAGGVAERQTFGNRYGIETTQQGLRILGIHPDDYSEKYRIEAAIEVVAHMGEYDNEEPKIIMGDFNAMSYEDWRSKLVRRTVRPVTEGVRTVLPEDFNYYRYQGDKALLKKLHRAASVGIRLADMTAGDSVRQYESAGFTNLDSDQLATLSVSKRLPPLVKIDHILGQNVEALDYKRTATEISDHSFISARVQY